MLAVLTFVTWRRLPGTAGMAAIGTTLVPLLDFLDFKAGLERAGSGMLLACRSVFEALPAGASLRDSSGRKAYKSKVVTPATEDVLECVAMTWNCAEAEHCHTAT